MTFKTLYFLTATFIMVFGTGAYLHNFTGNKHTKKPVNTGINIKYINTSIRTQTDTVLITDEMLANHTIIAAGVFMPRDGIIKINYLKPASSTPRTISFCETNNLQIPLVRRHEIEHARKAILTKNIWHYSPITRGRIASQNEIIAPAAEIIEALDYRYQTGQAFPTRKPFIKKADRLITNIALRDKLKWPLDFNNPKLADIIMQCATERFLAETNRGLYKTTIKEAMLHTIPNRYITNDMCKIQQTLCFYPEFNLWGPLWQFESLHGDVNIWDNASQTQKEKLLHATDSVIQQITGKNAYLFVSVKTR